MPSDGGGGKAEGGAVAKRKAEDTKLKAAAVAKRKALEKRLGAAAAAQRKAAVAWLTAEAVAKRMTVEDGWRGQPQRHQHTIQSPSSS